MNRSERLQYLKLIDSIVDEYGLVLPPGYKRRDPAEPHRLEKESWEVDLFRSFRDRFRSQLRMVEEYLNRTELKSTTAAAAVPLEDPGSTDLIFEVFVSMLQDGMEKYSLRQQVSVSWSQYNEAALKYADDYVFKMIEGVDDVTRKRLARELSLFVEQEGYTIGDVISGLEASGLDLIRAEQIAVSEVTRTFGVTEQMGGEVLQAEYPEVQMVKTWFTNNDSLVCPICRPLHERTVKLREEYAPGVMHPPGHPKNCRCWHQSYSVLDEDEIADLLAEPEVIEEEIPW